MDLSSLSKRSDSSIGTVVGLAFVVLAVLGSTVLDWEWTASINQPVPLAIGVIAAAVALVIVFQKLRE